MSMLYELNGEISPACDGWEFIPSEAKDGMTFNPAEGYYPDKGGKLMGPVIPGVEEFQHYSLSFEAESRDGGHWAVFFLNDAGKLITADVYASIYNEQKDYKVVVYSRHDAVSMQPFFQSLQGVRVANLRIEKISVEEAAAWCDEIYDSLPPLAYTPPESAMQLLPKTAAALRDGTPWRVVMLGDSIINDTFNGNFQALIKRSMPNSNFNWICSVRGSTGCWHYQEPENYQEYVTDLKPDLLIVGGISQKDDYDAVKKVLSMTRDQLDCEVMLLSGPFGTYEAMTKLPLFARRLEQLAEEMNIEFMDCCDIWAGYMAKTDIPMEYFYRDPVHANDRGKQIIGRAMNRYFSS